MKKNSADSRCGAPLAGGERLCYVRTMFSFHRPTANPAACPLPVYQGVAAGFPSPAADHMERRLDIHDLLVRRPASTFFCRAQGPSMRDRGIQDGDLLVVDRSIPPQQGDVVVATLEGGLTVKILQRQDSEWCLVAAHPDYPPLPINPEDGLTIWGVVTFAVTPLCSR